MREFNEPVMDLYERPLKDLRISVTGKCNFRCRYCMPEEIFGPNYLFMNEKSMLSFDEIIALIKGFVVLGVDKVRITGGEPLLRKDLHHLVSKIKETSDIKDIALTTNGSLLGKHAESVRRNRKSSA